MHIFEAGSHFEAMTIYRGLMGETYTTTHAQDYEPYPEEWAARQRGGAESEAHCANQQ